ncbi:MAG: hypothetical protein HYX45_18520 [Burkholderiales bacterium]|nr:hypothetical protein [Burkholderiales bacterium]
MENFLWQPGLGHDQAALVRLRSHFERPREPMGEAWFMSDERKMYPELLGDLASLSCRELQDPLTEVASGTCSFGEMEEWTVWYHYLLGQLIPRSHECFVDSFLEYLVTGFIAIHPTNDGAEPYAGFRLDALNTLGRCIMDPSCWDGSEIRLGRILHRSNNNPNRVWCWWDASGDFSASMFFCLKYLPVSQVPGWIESVFTITSPHWRAQILVWLLGARDILIGAIKWPSDFKREGVASVSWAWSHCLGPNLAGIERTLSSAGGSLITEAAANHVLNAVRGYFTQERYLEWLMSFDQVPYVRDEISHLPRDFEAVYMR